MEFEFDENKSKINKIKHGIDFIEAQKLWEQSDFIFFPAKEVNGEERYLLSAFLQDKCLLLDGKIRIISVRRCRKNEKERIKL